VYPHFFVLTVLAFAFCPRSTTHTTQTSMPPPPPPRDSNPQSQHTIGRRHST
jgi:hypothetical protein